MRSTPIGLLRRENLPGWKRASGGDGPIPENLTTPAAAVLEFLRRHGASFFTEMVSGTGLLKTQVEEGLGELVSRGLVSADSFGGLRALIVPTGKRVAGYRRRRRAAAFGIETSGRWFTVDAREEALPEAAGGTPGVSSGPGPVESVSSARPGADERRARDRDIESVARKLLLRYGVVFRALMDREGRLPPWRELLLVFRRLEARGEIRGGRFVAGFTGEQYALPEAVSDLRKARRAKATGVSVVISAADPLNLTGTLLAGERIAAITGNRILFRDGVPIAVYEKKAVRTLVEMDTAERWRVQEALVRRRGEGRMRVGVRLR